MDQPEKKFEYIVKEKPLSAGIDRYLKLVNRTPKNNVYKFGITPEKPNLNANGENIFMKFGEDD